MRFQIRLFIIFLSLLVILPAFLLTSRPAFASVSHIVRLKRENGSPVTNVEVNLHSWRITCSGGDEEWCNDCDCGSEGPTWKTNTDEYGIASFLMTADSLYCSGWRREGYYYQSVQRCSTGWAAPLTVAIPYLSESGYWRLDAIDQHSWFRPIGSRCDPDEEESCRYQLKDDRGLEYGYWSGRWTGYNDWGHRGNLARINLNSGDGPGAKNTNIHWLWTWVRPAGAQNPSPEKQTFLGFANDFFVPLQTFLKNLFRS